MWGKKKPEAKLRVGGDKDPLIKQPQPNADLELFKQFSKLCNGFPTDCAIAASGNVLLNALRQQNGTRRDAELAFDELFGRLKSILMVHYDGPSGQRRNVFPFRQVIDVPHLDLRGKR